MTVIFIDSEVESGRTLTGPDLQKKAHTRSVSYGENYSEGYPITHKKAFLGVMIFR